MQQNKGKGADEKTPAKPKTASADGGDKEAQLKAALEQVRSGGVPLLPDRWSSRGSKVARHEEKIRALSDERDALKRRVADYDDVMGDARKKKV
jgi:hypothetical protein